MSGANGPLPTVAPDSTQAGFVRPTASASYYLEDDALDNFFQQLVSGITGLPPTLVRPLWQAEPVNLPDFGTNWAAVGLIESELAKGWSYRQHESADTGSDLLETWEYCTFLVACYGPNAERYDGLLRDGLFLPQNQELLRQNNLGLVEWLHRAVVPQLIKERWWRRVDRHIRVFRSIVREYPIRNILSVPISITGEDPTGTLQITETRTVTPPGIT
jgi:hypothetical protein